MQILFGKVGRAGEGSEEPVEARVRKNLLTLNLPMARSRVKLHHYDIFILAFSHTDLHGLTILFTRESGGEGRRRGLGRACRPYIWLRPIMEDADYGNDNNLKINCNG